jgi:ABC-2 type transport system ATP-binding protein
VGISEGASTSARGIATGTCRPGRPADGPAVEIVQLRKTYGAVVAVDDVSFSVAEGEIFGILGPNGAGKTTTVECITGLRRPDAGRVRVLGLDPQVDGPELHEVVGVQLQSSQLQGLLRVREILDLYRSFYRNPASADELMEVLGLAGKRDVRYKTLSGGRNSGCRSRWR